ncbi:hypothetical protein [Dietzia psychralcaliphila]|uniref:Uncharacterized protein n=1 Tax=Dietzia psychralcaliphila TaxID=139021 RepID=A0AAD0NMH9_9ACTN|nr:hypothetical protein [Dietzia psychralcaliphila]AWH94271.1 hypothetical protein A6048_00660 [Dietzia psychralcaliphila]PTM87871.1 hypothetical protein C8N39_10486 [Dietzia psychralcaliphila]
MKEFTLDHAGTRLTVEFDQSMLFYYRARLIVGDATADERPIFMGSVMLRSADPALRVEAVVGWWGPKKAVLHDEARDQSVSFTRSR